MSKRNVVCPGCSLLCDGLTPDENSNVPTEASGCAVATDWFSQRTIPNETSAADVERIKMLLDDAVFPLITGIENLTVESQQAAARMADRFRAAIDTGWSNAGRGSMASFQRYGKVTATLGEIASRSDLVVFWFCDPVKTHPRFIERFVNASDQNTKQLIVIDETETETAKLANQFIKLDAASAFEFVQQQRIKLGQDDSTDEFVNLLASSSYGSLMLGKPSGTDAAFDLVTDQWFQLVNSLNDRTRFVMSSLRNDRNGLSANNVLTSLSGFPDAVRFTDSGPCWNGLEYSTKSLIERRDCDLLLACDSGCNEPFEANLDAATLQWLRSIPVIVLSDLPANKYTTADVVVTTGTPGWTMSGDFVRTDDIPIPLSAAAGVELPSSFDLFEELLA